MNLDFWITSEGVHIVLIDNYTVRHVGVLWITA
jgi:hypothetical protein